MKTTNQLSASLEQDARQLRLAMEADVTAVKKTRKRMESTTTADRAKHIGDSSSVSQVDPDQMCLTSFDDDSTRFPALPCFKG